jgi:hypothetical protein
MATYVIIWENNGLGHQKVKEATWAGHAAINIGECFDVSFVGLTSNYVSWWPNDGDSEDPKAKLGKLGEFGNAFGPNRAGGRQFSIVSDVREEGYLPDHVIRLDTSEDQEKKMRAAWKEIYNKKGGASFKYFRKNCSTIASRVLHAGGLYSKKWAANLHFVWTPADIRKLALGAGGELMSWTDFLAVLAKDYVEPTAFKKYGEPVTHARSGVYCTTGAPVKYQKDKRKGIRDAVVLD